MRIVDANVLLVCGQHVLVAPRSRQVMAGQRAGRGGYRRFAWPVLLAFLRLATHRAVFERPLTATEAAEIVRSWLARPAAVVVSPSARHLDLLAGLLADAGTAGNLVSDAHLAALAIEHDAALVSFDTDFARFGGLRWINPNVGISRESASLSAEPN